MIHLQTGDFFYQAVALNLGVNASIFLLMVKIFWENRILSHVLYWAQKENIEREALLLLAFSY